jgi:hypothetical protein
MPSGKISRILIDLSSSNQIHSSFSYQLLPLSFSSVPLQCGNGGEISDLLRCDRSSDAVWICDVDLPVAEGGNGDGIDETLCLSQEAAWALLDPDSPDYNRLGECILAHLCTYIQHTPLC